MKNKKRIYSLVAIIMVLVLSVPNVALASDTFKFTTWECVKDKYTEGTWQDMVLESAYMCTNKMYEYFEPFLSDFPFDCSSYDYYAFFVKGYELWFYGFDTQYYTYLCVGAMNTSWELDDDDDGFELLKSHYDSYISGIESNSFSNVNNFAANLDGTYDAWYINCSSTSNSWTQTKDDYSLSNAFSSDYNGPNFSFSAILVNTNMDLYSKYEFWGIVSATDEDANYGNTSRSHIPDVIAQMEILNIGVDYYDGENIISGTPTYDTSLGFDSFTIEKINHPDVFGGTGALLNWSLTPETLENITPEWKIQFDFVVSYSIYEIGGLTGKTTFEEDVFYHTVELPLETYSKQNGSYLYDTLYGYTDGAMEANFIKYVFDAFSSDSSYKFSNSFLGQYIANALGTDSWYGNVYNSALNTDVDYGFSYLDIQVEACLVNNSSNTRTNSCGGHVDLIGGQNSSWVNQVSDDGTSESVDPDSVTSGNNYYNVVQETDNGGNVYYNYYYYDTTDNTVTPSIGYSDTMNIVLTFANSLNLTGVSSGSSSSSSSSSGDNIDLTIEDDDYTDTALREDLADGFGLLDNNETEELDDGYLSVAAAFFNNIDEDASQILMFGISSVVVIGILRAVFRR